MSQLYPDGPEPVAEPFITKFGFDEPKVYWLWCIWILAAIYCGGFVLLNWTLLRPLKTWFSVL